MPTLRVRTGNSTLSHAELDANFKRTVTQKTTTYQVLISDNRAIIEGNHASTPFTITLPPVATADNSETGDFEVTITNINAAAVTVDGSGAEAIDNTTTLVLQQWASATFILDSAQTGWKAVAKSNVLSHVGALTVSGALTASGTSSLVGVTTHGGDVLSDTTSTDSIGSTAVRWLKGWFDSLTVTGDVGAATGTFTGEVTGLGFTGTLDGVLGGGTPAAVTGTTITANTSFSGAGTGLTGTAASLTAGNVTTNANLTGAITSSGSNATSLGSFTTAQLLTAVTGETGTGAVVFGTSPTLVTPALGTPASGVLTSCTGTAAGLTAGTATVANGLKTATTTVSVSASAAPSTGQTLVAVDSTTATWQTPAGSGIVSNTGTPLNNQLAVWTDATTVEGDAALTWDGTSLVVGVDDTTRGNLVLYGPGTGQTNGGEILMHLAADHDAVFQYIKIDVANDDLRITDSNNAFITWYRGDTGNWEFPANITVTGQATATGFTGTLDGILGSGTPAAVTATTVTASGVVSVDDTTDSTSTITGSIHTDGGLGVAKDVFVGGAITVDSIVQPTIKIIEIGAWDMDTTSTLSVAHGLTSSTIRSITAAILSDDTVTVYDFASTLPGTGTGNHTLNWNATNINFVREASGVFDSTSFNGAGNRGWVTITYV